MAQKIIDDDEKTTKPNGMKRLFSFSEKGGSLLLFYPLIIIVMQIVPTVYALVGGIIFILVSLFVRKLRSLFLLGGITIIGHCVWAYFTQLISLAGLSEGVSLVLGRLGLIGYLILFLCGFVLYRQKTIISKLENQKKLLSSL